MRRATHARTTQWSALVRAMNLLCGPRIVDTVAHAPVAEPHLRFPCVAVCPCHASSRALAWLGGGIHHEWHGRMVQAVDLKQFRSYSLQIGTQEQSARSH